MTSVECVVPQCAANFIPVDEIHMGEARGQRQVVESTQKTRKERERTRTVLDVSGLKDHNAD